MLSEPTTLPLHTHKCRADDRPPPHPSFFMFAHVSPRQCGCTSFVHKGGLFVYQRHVFIVFFVSLSQLC